MKFRSFQFRAISLTTLAGLALSFGATFAMAQSDQPRSYEQIRQTVFHSSSYNQQAAPQAKIPIADSATEAAKQKQESPQFPKKAPGVINFDIYRDRSPLPIDPRKPCNECTTRQTDGCEKSCLDCVPGWKGQPYRDLEPGGCKCSKRCRGKKRKPFFSIYWPSVLNAVREEHHPNKAARRDANLNYFRINNLFDCLGGFELSAYERCDNGYCGPGRDRFGCLGESRYLQSNVTGVDFRPPAQPVPRGGIQYPPSTIATGHQTQYQNSQSYGR